MMRHIFGPSAKLFLSVSSAVVIACFSVPAFAAASVMAGCQPDETAAMAAKATALVAYDNAVTSQLMVQPPSVLTLTCFDQQAAVYGTNGGAIFSSVSKPPSPAPPSLTSLIAKIDPTISGSAPPFNCTAIGALWNTIVKEGVNTSNSAPASAVGNTPYATFDDLMNGTEPTGTTNPSVFKTAWDAANAAGTFNALNTANTTYATDAGLYNVPNTNDNADTAPPSELQFMSGPGAWNCNGTFGTQTAAAAVAAYAINGTACP